MAHIDHNARHAGFFEGLERPLNNTDGQAQVIIIGIQFEISDTCIPEKLIFRRQHIGVHFAAAIDGEQAVNFIDRGHLHGLAGLPRDS